MFTLQVRKNQIEVVKAKIEPMTSGSKQVYPIQFMFSSEWKYLEKVAVFATDMTKDGPTKNPVYNMLLDKNNRCFIPWEVNLVHSNHVYVGIFGTYNGEVVLPTVWADLGNVLLGVTTGIDIEPPTPELYEQILAELSKIRGEVEDFTAKNLKVFENETVTSIKDFGELPRSVVMTDSSIATDPDLGRPPMSWPFLSEVVYVKDGVYPDINQNETPAIFVSDMTGKTYACHYNEAGAIMDMTLVEPEPIKWSDIKGKPDMRMFTRTRFTMIELSSMKWNTQKEQTVDLPGIIADKAKQLIIPVPTDPSYDTYYTCDIRLVGQEEGKLTFRAYATPSTTCSLYIYALNATDQWVGDGNGDDLAGSSTKYEFDDDFDTEYNKATDTMMVSVKTVDSLDVTDKSLPMSVQGVENIINSIRDMLAEV